MKKLIYDPAKSGKRMNIVCWISGSGTNYREIVNRDPDHNYLVFTNRPGCKGLEIARQNQHEIIELSHIPYLKEARKRYGAEKAPRNSEERTQFEQEACRLIEERLGKEPDLVCLAGYDQWLTDWTVDKYYPKMINVHPGDTAKGYFGLHWIPAARAIFGGDTSLRSTLFIVDKGEDTGPVLVQSALMNIKQALTELESQGKNGLIDSLKEIVIFCAVRGIKSYEEFREKAGEKLNGKLETVCSNLQEALKAAGDWEIYPFGVHDLIARGRVEIEDRKVYVDGRELPAFGYRLDG